MAPDLLVISFIVYFILFFFFFTVLLSHDTKYDFLNDSLNVTHGGGCFVLQPYHLCCISHTLACCKSEWCMSSASPLGLLGAGRRELTNQTKMSRAEARLSCSVASRADRLASVNRAVLRFPPVFRALRRGLNLLSCLKQSGTFSDLKFSCTGRLN